MRINEIKEHQWLGIPQEKEERILLKAGKLEVEFRSGRLVNFKYEGKAVLSEIYFALRDQNWNTIPYRVKDLKISEQEDEFEVVFRAEHDADGIQYKWEGRITGNSENEITYSFHGVSHSSFLRNRIGFCVLHPAECAGKRCRVIHSDGEIQDSEFPKQIAPHQPFFEIKELKYWTDGLKVITKFEGDIFEMEDQRNWTDASFKTYCTPLGKLFPVKVYAGDEVSQKVVVKAEGHTESEEGTQEDELNFEKISNCKGIYLGSVIKNPMSQTQLELVRRLKLNHVRYDYHFAEDHGCFSEIMDQMKTIRVKVLLAVFFTDHWEIELKEILKVLEEWKSEIGGITVFQEKAKVIEASRLGEIRKVLKPAGIPVGSGTDAFFTQINREPLPREEMDFVSYSNNPQVHAFDNDSIMETTEGQTANVLSCRKLFRDLPVAVSSVSLKMRWNPDLTAEEETPEGIIPRRIDPRQMSLFAAAWFIRSLVSLIQAGACSADYFELLGPAGLMQPRELPDYDFPVTEGMLYPLYFAMYFVAGEDKCEIKVRKTREYAAIRMKYFDRTRVILANSKDREIEIRTKGLPENLKEFGMNGENILWCIEHAQEIFEENVFKKTEFIGQIKLKAYEIRILDF